METLAAQRLRGEWSDHSRPQPVDEFGESLGELPHPACDNTNLLWFAKNRSLEPTRLAAQMRFVWYELTNFSYYGLADLRQATTIEQATVVFMNKYEGCGTCHTERRVTYSQQVYDRYAVG